MRCALSLISFERNQLPVAFPPPACPWVPDLESHCSLLTSTAACPPSSSQSPFTPRGRASPLVSSVTLSPRSPPPPGGVPQRRPSQWPHWPTGRRGQGPSLQGGPRQRDQKPRTAFPPPHPQESSPWLPPPRSLSHPSACTHSFSFVFLRSVSAGPQPRPGEAALRWAFASGRLGVSAEAGEEL